MITCRKCGYRLTPVYPDQTLHPMCDPNPPGLTDEQRDALIARIDAREAAEHAERAT